MKKQKILVYIFLIALLELIFIFLFKYNYNNLELGEFSLAKIGNIIDLAFSLLLVIPLLFHLAKSKTWQNRNFKFILKLSIIYFLLLVLAFILNLINFKFPQTYVLGYPLQKIVFAVFLISYKIIQLYVIILLWSMLFIKGITVYLSSVILLALGIIIILSCTYLYNLSFPKTEFKKDDTAEYNIGVVFGAAVWSTNMPSPLFKGRIEKAFQLFKSRRIKKIQVTGGNAPGEISEAKAAYNYLVFKHNIDKNKILIEENTSTTTEQVKFIKSHLIRKKQDNKIIVISDQFHLRRVLQICNFFNVNAIGISSDYNLNWRELFFYRLRDSIGLLLFWIFGI
ncbi:hypothetical protein BMS3Abin04_00295 [bacterium BMS3Abin04]|nr:hypothetical protein BMS3Abin04_00295 [bacterium BMS3Abin04]